MSDRFESNTAPREFENPHNPCYSEHLDYEHLQLRFYGTPIDKTLQNEVAHYNMFCYKQWDVIIFVIVLHQWEPTTDWWPAWSFSRSQVGWPRLLPGWWGTCGSSRGLLPVGRSRFFLISEGILRRMEIFLRQSWLWEGGKNAGGMVLW